MNTNELIHLSKVSYKKELRKVLAAKRHELEELLIVRFVLNHPEFTYSQIAESRGISLRSLHNILEKHDVESRERGRASSAYVK